MEVLLVMEERDRAQDFVERFKLAVVSADPKRWVREMFPNWITPSEPEPVVEDVDLSDTTGTWTFADMDRDQVLADLAAEDGLMVGGMTDLGDEWMEA